MPNYTVKLTFKYSDVVHVEARDEKDAIAQAIDAADEQYECFYDAEVREEE